MSPTTIEILATIVFGIAIIHTFSVKRFEVLSRRFPENSTPQNIFHFLAEVEVVFGLWAGAFLLMMAAILGSTDAIAYLESAFSLPAGKGPISVDFTEPVFVFAIMAMAATRPVLDISSRVIAIGAKALPLPQEMAFYVSALIVGPLLGSFITEPASMTVTALILKERFYDRGLSKKLAYATLGLLFVNISLGGTLTHFAAPPVIMVASAWDLDIMYMLTHIGWKSAIAVILSTIIVSFAFRQELRALTPISEDSSRAQSPMWLIITHLVLINAVIMTNEHIPVFMGFFLFFLGVVAATRIHQDEMKLKEALLVGYFLMGLVVLGGLQSWWLEPILTSLDELPLFFGTASLSAITDNAALTYLGSQVEGLSDASKYAMLAGAVATGGVTVIANAPNPAGFGILKPAFGKEGISPLGLFVSALGPTIIGIAALLLLPNL